MNTPKPPSRKPKALLTQPLKIGYQRVNIDVDMAQQRIEGLTEITVFPLLAALRVIRLDSREMRIKNVYINNSRHTNYIHKDMLYINDDTYFDECVEKQVINMFDLYAQDIGIHQHHLIKQKLNYIFGENNYDPREPAGDGTSEHYNENTGELCIILPDHMKLELTSINHINTPGSVGTPLHLKSKSTHNDIFTPIYLKIEYELVNPKNGVNFITHSPDRRNWHAYTTNATHSISTSSWVPCIDNLWDRCTWSIEVNIPRTVKDIGNPRVVGSRTRLRARRREKDDFEYEEDDDDADNRDLVVCCGDFNNVKETPHPIDRLKKVVSWSIFNPVCAHHVGWALGCFDSFVLVDEVDDEKEQGLFKDDMYEGEKDVKQPVTVYCLPDNVELARNTAIFSNNALDFFVREFGSFPFSSYAIVFVEGSTTDANSFAGLSVVHDKLLYPADLIEPIFHLTDVLLESIASQWSGINVAAHTFNDLWCTVGIARYMAMQYTRRLMGENEYRFKLRRLIDQIVDEDYGRKPLAVQFYRFPINETDLEFVRLKAPLVLHILDKRMTKTDKLFGLLRVIPKLFLQAMLGDLHNGTLLTPHFQYVCEKVNRNKLEPFFKQWVYGSGAPVFNISQRFNKKRGLIEMSIRQVQAQQKHKVRPLAKNFLDDAVAVLDDEPKFPVQPVFTGPMTIRVHELDGTPYEHIVELKDGHTKVDIQYNAKFKRMKKLKEDMDESIATFNRLGDVLLSERERAEWGLVDFERPEDELLFADAFEWIRVDVDYEWIGRFEIKQQDYMYASQLVYDRDVEAQYHAVKHFGDTEKPTREHCTVLTRTLADPRYYYGVRIAAAEALARFLTQSNQFIGVNYLIRTFKHHYCFEGSAIPRSNDFSDVGKFLLQRAIPKILSGVKDDDGATPAAVRHLLLNLVKFNDNANNAFQDCFYVARLVEALVRSVCNGESLRANQPDKIDPQLEKVTFSRSAGAEVDRLQNLDIWVPSHQHVVAVTCIRGKIEMARFGMMTMSFEDLLYFTTEKYADDVRVEAFRGLFVLGGLKNKSVMMYFLKTCLIEAQGSYFRGRLLGALIESICVAALEGTPSTLDDPEFHVDDKPDSAKVASNMVIIEDGSNSEMDAKRDTFTRATLKGAIDLLRRDYLIGAGLKEVLWELLHTSLLSIYERRNVFTVCQILYQQIDSLVVRIPVPSVPVDELKKKIVLKNWGDGVVMFKREGRFKIQLLTRKDKSEKKPKTKEREKMRHLPRKKEVEETSRSSRSDGKAALGGTVKAPLDSIGVRAPNGSNGTIAPNPNVTVFDTFVTIKLGSRSKDIKVKEEGSAKTQDLITEVPLLPVDEPTEHSNGTEKSPSVSVSGTVVTIRRLRSVNRYVKINTKEKKVLISPSPFTSVKTEEVLLQDPDPVVVAERSSEPPQQPTSKASSLARLPTKQASKVTKPLPKKKAKVSKLTSAPPVVKVKTEEDENVLRRKRPLEGGSKLKLTRTALSEVEPSLRAVSPFESRSSTPFDSTPPAKRKKTKIYIHGSTNSQESASPDAEGGKETKELDKVPENEKESESGKVENEKRDNESKNQIENDQKQNDQIENAQKENGNEKKDDQKENDEKENDNEKKDGDVQEVAADATQLKEKHQETPIEKLQPETLVIENSQSETPLGNAANNETPAPKKVGLKLKLKLKPEKNK